VADERENERRRLLDPVDRISEIQFGLITAVTILGSPSIATAGKEEVRTAMTAALGCNLAWRLVDAAMYVVRTAPGGPAIASFEAGPRSLETVLSWRELPGRCGTIAVKSSCAVGFGTACRAAGAEQSAHRKADWRD
jgi:hypothetical protein